MVWLGNLLDSIIHGFYDLLPRYWKDFSMHYQVDMLSGKQNILKMHQDQSNLFFFFLWPKQSYKRATVLWSSNSIDMKVGKNIISYKEHKSEPRDRVSDSGQTSWVVQECLSEDEKYPNMQRLMVSQKEHCRRTYKRWALETAWAWQVRAREQEEDYLEYSRAKIVVEK